jgi:hypothetical protein
MRLFRGNGWERCSHRYMFCDQRGGGLMTLGGMGLAPSVFFCFFCLACLLCVSVEESTPVLRSVGKQILSL